MKIIFAPSLSLHPHRFHSSYLASWDWTLQFIWKPLLLLLYKLSTNLQINCAFLLFVLLLWSSSYKNIFNKNRFIDCMSKTMHVSFHKPTPFYRKIQPRSSSDSFLIIFPCTLRVAGSGFIKRDMHIFGHTINKTIFIEMFFVWAGP